MVYEIIVHHDVKVNVKGEKPISSIYVTDHPLAAELCAKITKAVNKAMRIECKKLKTPKMTFKSSGGDAECVNIK